MAVERGSEIMAIQEIGQHAEERRTGQQNGKGDRLATGLGWFSIGLGAAEVFAPSKLARLIGVESGRRGNSVLRLYGLREIAAGAGILTGRRPAGWLWARVAGDAVDLASLGSALKAKDASRGRVGVASAAVIGVTALDLICAQNLSRESIEEISGRMDRSGRSGEVHVTKTIIVNREPSEVYRFWRDFRNLGTVLTHLESVQELGDKRSHWVANGPGGIKVEWDAEIVDDQPDNRIAWRSLKGSDIDNSGFVEFVPAPGKRGTLVKVHLQYTPPMGAVTAKIAKIFRREPGQQIEEDLRAFKQLMETGEVAKSDASVHWGMHPGRPPAARAATA
jgi:uncharacterized membrane protein